MNKKMTDKTLPKKMAIICSEVKKEYFPTLQAYETEKYALRDAKRIAQYITRLGIATKVFPANNRLIVGLKSFKPDLAINVVDSINGIDSKASTIPVLLEFLNIPYTGCNTTSIAMGYNKFLVKQLMDEQGIPVPQGQLFTNSISPLKKSLRFPLISKLNNIHGSVGLINDSISDSEIHLRKRIQSLLKEYPQSAVLVEEYIQGKEISVFVVEDNDKKHIYMSEDTFTHSKNPYTIASFEFRWVENNPGISMNKYISKELELLARKAFSALDMSGYGKFDIRKDSKGIHHFIDANPNPAFAPPESDSPLANTALNFYGVSFPRLLTMIMQSGLRIKR
jgi:D-alanine-D-alanine ligase